LYSLLFTLGVFAAAPYYLWRLHGRITCTADWKERFGFLPESFRQTEQGAIWIHAVSVGETLAIVGLVGEIQRRFPERKIYLSHVTPAGREAGAARMPAVAGRFLLPLDWSGCARRIFRTIRPALLLIVETELWPNLLRAAQEEGTRVLVVNARISDRSFPRYRLIHNFMQRVLEKVDRICAQSEIDAARFRALGAHERRVMVSGNLKFDAQPPRTGEFTHGLADALRRSDRGPVIVAASTMPGEESMVLEAWREIRKRHERAFLILAPRHPARFDEVAELLSQGKTASVRRTMLAESERELTAQIAGAEILLLDTIGELMGVFELGDIVFMGGSLVPAFWGKPILFGPHMHNFRDIAQLFLQSQAAIQVPDAPSLGRTVLELIDDPTRRGRLGEAAKRVLDQQRGATARVVQIIAEWLGTPVAAQSAAGRTDQ